MASQDEQLRSLGPRVAWMVLGIAIVEAILLLGFGGFDAGPILGGDGPGYHALALNLLSSHTFSASDTQQPNITRTPGYPGFIALLYSVGNNSYLSLRLGQLVLLAATAWLLFPLALEWFSAPVGILAALLCVTYPPFVFQALYHASETLATFLAVAFIYVFVQAQKGQSLLLFFLTGLVAGAATLVRPAFALLVLVPVGFAFARIARSAPRALGLAALVLLGFVVLMLPWTLRNALVSQRFIPLAVASGMSLYVSTQQYSGAVSYRLTIEEWQHIIEEFLARQQQARHAGEGQASTVASEVALALAIDDRYRHDAFDRMLSLRPVQVAASLPPRLAYLWSTGDTSPWPVGFFHRIVQLQFGLLAGLSAWGCWTSRAALRRQWPLWLIPCYLVLVHSVFHMETRYSFPGRPFLFLYAGLALTQIASLGPRGPQSLPAAQPA